MKEQRDLIERLQRVCCWLIALSCLPSPAISSEIYIGYGDHVVFGPEGSEVDRSLPVGTIVYGHLPNRSIAPGIISRHTLLPHPSDHRDKFLAGAIEFDDARPGPLAYYLVTTRPPREAPAEALRPETTLTLDDGTTARIIKTFRADERDLFRPRFERHQRCLEITLDELLARAQLLEEQVAFRAFELSDREQLILVALRLTNSTTELSQCEHSALLSYDLFGIRVGRDRKALSRPFSCDRSLFSAATARTTSCIERRRQRSKRSSSGFTTSTPMEESSFYSDSNAPKHSRPRSFD